MQWHILELETIDSTNDEARRLAKTHDGPIAVRTETQTAGRGQYGRKWMSPPGKNLLATYSIPLELVTAPSLLSLNIGTVLQNLLNGYGITPDCKWPNDLIVSGYKIAGILIEQDDGKSYIGIGMNCAWPESRTETPDGARITSIMAENGATAVPGTLFRDICDELWSCIHMSAEDITSRYRDAWCDAGRQVQVYTNDTWCPGRLSDINSDGTLTVKLENGTESIITSSACIKLEDG